MKSPGLISTGFHERAPRRRAAAAAKQLPTTYERMAIPRRGLLGLLLLLLLLGLRAAATQPATAGSKSVLLLMADDLRPVRLAWHALLRPPPC